MNTGLVAKSLRFFGLSLGTDWSCTDHHLNLKFISKTDSNYRFHVTIGGNLVASTPCSHIQTKPNTTKINQTWVAKSLRFIFVSRSQFRGLCAKSLRKCEG